MATSGPPPLAEARSRARLDCPTDPMRAQPQRERRQSEAGGERPALFLTFAAGALVVAQDERSIRRRQTIGAAADAVGGFIRLEREDRGALGRDARGGDRPKQAPPRTG